MVKGQNWGNFFTVQSHPGERETVLCWNMFVIYHTKYCCDRKMREIDFIGQGKESTFDS